MRIFPTLVRGLDAMLETAFPSACVSCGGVVEDSAYAAVCSDCAYRVQLIESPKCLTCGFPFFGDTESRSYCMHCEHLRPEFGQGWSVALFRGPVRELLHALKYERGFWALRDLRKMLDLSFELQGFLGDAVLVPVPLHPRRLRERGFNQSELIAKELLRCAENCAFEEMLVRVLDTVSQTNFNRQERIRNLRNAFSTKAKRAIDPAKRYVVVDDVFTTGSTVNACAAALRKAGAKRVDVVTIGHG